VSQANPYETTASGLNNCGPRRLPLFFLLDFSAAPRMGFAAAATEQVRRITDQLQVLAQGNRDAYLEAPVCYTVMVFRTSALQFHPMAPPGVYPFSDLRLDEIAPQGEPGFAAAFETVCGSLERELKMPGAANGDSQPLVFLFTDGIPAERWVRPPFPKLFVCGIESLPALPAAAGPIPAFIPIQSWADIPSLIEAERELLKPQQQMIDYPLDY
jgi:hypothetical protein